MALQQRARMNKFQSHDYWERGRSITLTNRETFLMWCMISLTGIAVGVWSVMLYETLTALLDIREKHVIEESLKSKPLGVAWLYYCLWSVGLVAMSTVICHRMPQAAGSGLPEVRAYLNGVHLPKMFALPTMLVKTLSCILAVAGGLPAGPEGPVIHIGAMIAAAVTRLSQLPSMRHPRVVRDFITAGTAAGVTAAFGAPVGGLLFVIEEISSFFSVRMAWMLFLCCLCCNFVMNVMLTYFQGWTLRDIIPNATPGDIAPDAVELFGVDKTVPMNVVVIPLSMVLGVICGILGAFFTRGSVHVIKVIRNPVLNRSAFLRCLEPCVVSFLLATVTFFIPFGFSCQNIPPNISMKDFGWITNGTKNHHFSGIMCAGNESDVSHKVYNPMASLGFAKWVETLQMLLARGPFEVFPPDVLVTWFVVYYLFAMYSHGMYLSSGVLIPIMILGAMVGSLFASLLRGLFGSGDVLDHGILAMIGMAGFFSGVTRLTFSLCVMVLEMSNDVQHLSCIITCVFVAKVVADLLTECSLELAVLKIKCVPFLDWESSVSVLDSYVARHVMRGPVTTFAPRERISVLASILLSQPHNCFPIVEGNRLLGVVNREHVRILLWHVYYNRTRGDGAELSHARLDDILETVLEEYPPIPDEPAMDEEVSLALIANTSPFVVHEEFSMYETYCLFRSLGLRHLLVVNDAHAVIGMITRKDLVETMLDAKLTTAPLLSPRRDPPFTA